MVMNMDAPDTARRDTTGSLGRGSPARARSARHVGTRHDIALARFRERAAAAAESRRDWCDCAAQTVYAMGSHAPTVAGARASLLHRATSCVPRWMRRVCCLLLTPATRAAAQRLWDVFFAERVEFVTLDVDKLPRSFTDQHIRLIGANACRSPASRGGGDVRGSRRDCRTHRRRRRASHAVQVTGAISLEWRINSGDLEAAARNAGLTDLHFPPRLGRRPHRHPFQSDRHRRLSCVPTDSVDAARDHDAAGLRSRARSPRTSCGSAALSPSAARTFSAQMAAAPFALVAISPDEEVTMRQVRLRAGEGTLVHDLNDDGSLQRTTLVWSTPDRLYAISSEPVGRRDDRDRECDPDPVVSSA